MLKPGGTYISSELGPHVENLYLPLLTKIRGGKKVVFHIPSDIKGSLRFIQNLLENGQFKPVIYRKYPVEQIAKAYKYVASGQKTGNVIISFE